MEKRNGVTCAHGGVGCVSLHHQRRVNTLLYFVIGVESMILAVALAALGVLWQFMSEGDRNTGEQGFERDMAISELQARVRNLEWIASGVSHGEEATESAARAGVK